MSQVRREEFSSLIQYGNDTQKWIDKTNGQETIVTLPKLTPIRDMPTRWGSTYLSISRMRLLKQPLELYMTRRSEIFRHAKLTESEWAVLDHIGDILERPYILQEMMSRESTPMLAGSLPAYESVLASLKEAMNQRKYSYMQHAIQAGVDTMQKNYNERVFSKLFILAIAIHPSMRMRWFERKWSKSGVNYAHDVILEELYKYQSRLSPPAPSIPSYQSPQKDTRFKLYSDFLDEPNSTSSRRTSDCPIKKEFERYFGPNALDTYPSPNNINIIEWWDRNSDRYPTLFQIALDILPVQASSVAAERAFSSAAETDTLKRNRIKPALMEELQLLKYTINKDKFNFTQHWHCTEDMAEEENEYQDDVEGWKPEENGSDLENLSDNNESWESDSTDST